jgi:dolichol-phosphate mannosyltransferase
MIRNSTLIIVPTYNERDNVPTLVEQILANAPAVDVMIVDDNSPDGTADSVDEFFANDPRVSVLRRTALRGYGRSLLDGYRKALDLGYARVVQLDADFSHDPASIPSLLKASENADVVVGSRYCPGGGIGNWPLRRRALSRFANRYVSVLTGMGISDATSGFRCFNRRALEYLLEGPTLADGYAFLVETIYRVFEAGLRIVEVPIMFVDRREGQSKMSRKVIFESVLMPWRLRFSRYTPSDQQLLITTQQEEPSLDS